MQSYNPFLCSQIDEMDMSTNVQSSNDQTGWFPWSVVSEFSVNDIATIFLLLVAIATFCMSFIEARRRTRTERMIFVKQLIEPFRDDPDISSAFYKIEYDDFRYDPNTFHRSDLEREIDKLLSHCNLVCSFYLGKFLSESEFQQFNYYMTRVAENSEVQAYFDFLDSWSERSGLGSNFSNFRAVTEEAARKTQ